MRWASRGPGLDPWSPPQWLLPHQPDAARRIAGSLEIFRGALLADAVGLGKTYVALAVATRYRRPTVIAPASLIPQWRRVAERLRAVVTITSDQSLSRGRTAPAADLLIVDEAHRFRNPGTRRYDALACRPGVGHLLLLTATPVVNRGADLASLLSLFLPDNALAVLGVPSLRHAFESRDYARIAQAASAVIVARSPAVLSGANAIPHATNAAVLSPPPVASDELSPLVALLEELRFPTFADRAAAGLLALHLRYRLASSSAACLETLRRHLSYLDRASAAAERGERLSRRAARALFGPEDEFQLSLNLQENHPSPPVDAANLFAERQRIERIIARVRAHSGPSPKSERLRDILRARDPRKTIVFTAAVATARDLARSLGWRRVAVVSGRGAWIASGPLPLETALRLFAPLARGGPDPGPSSVVTTLLATDLASEGLDLQDADAVVHYDLPWTPLRLEQRLGRIARLGSTHRHVGVWWFTPPPELEASLALADRIAGKTNQQLSLGVPVSSRVGQARVLGQLFGWRERFIADARAVTASGPLYCVVAGHRAAIFALRWCVGGCSIPEVVVLEDGRFVADERRRGFLIDQLLSAPALAEAPRREDLEALYRFSRGRLAAADRGATDDQTTRLSHLLTRHAARVARRRDPDLLSSLDKTLDRVTAGLPEGARRKLDRLLHTGPNDPSLRRWLAHCPPSRGPFSVCMDAAVFGVGRTGPPFIPGTPVSCSGG